MWHFELCSDLMYVSGLIIAVCRYIIYKLEVNKGLGPSQSIKIWKWERSGNCADS